ncbi:apolipoprotein N-acyltransferase [Helicobacter mesocricetorum]|uniref:apolipoprotein N-acyltransferase n=1 Tax=Helicobacter mesocricetorum TaxID=87012 RepID=UPI000CF12498|nr:apolipoprotein N-acyltransferase [Helicobacter mesocricetorum]
MINATLIAPKRLSQSLIGIFCAICFSVFIYLEHFSLNSPIVSTLFAILGLFLYLQLSAFGGLVCGGLLGILWFYWIALSFRYYDITYLMPFMWIILMIVYGILFLFFCAFNHYWYKLLMLLCGSFIHPFGFNWFIPEAILTTSHFFPSKFILFLLLLSLAIFSILLTKKFYKISLLWLPISLISIYILTQQPTKPQSSLPKIKTLQTDIPQDLRWSGENLQEIIDSNLQAIALAIKEKYDVIILPETAFPITLNHHPKLLQILQDKSHKITIVTGGIYQDVETYNSAYLFENGEMQVFHKVILVPFGETIPLPSSLANFINELIFKGGNDFTKNPNTTPNSARINGQDFQLAICYEATREEYYQSSPKFLLAISNNAWFAPSIEPTLQKLLMLYFAKNYGTTIYHSSNASPSFILSP